MIAGTIILVLLVILLLILLRYLDNRNTQKMSFKQGFDLTELPIITLTNNGKNINFLLDTGSDSSYINQSILNNYTYTETEYMSPMIGVEGNKKDCNIIKMNVTYEDKSYQNEFLVMDMDRAFDVIKKENGVNLHGILGSKFFRKYQYVLDFDKLIAYSKKK